MARHRLDEILTRTIRSTIAESGGYNNRAGGGRGHPGYPVPDVLKRKIGPMSEVGASPSLPKGITHLEDLKPDEFLRWLEKYRDLPLKGGLEVSEKVDGSAVITFGVDEGGIWTQSKNGPRKHSVDEYPDKPMFSALRHAHAALESKEKEIRGWWDVSGNDVVLGAEVLYTRVPNSIEYGPNVIMIHSILGPGGVVSDEVSKKIAADLIVSTGGELSDGEDMWRFEYKRVVSPEDVMVDVQEEFDSIKQIYVELSVAKDRGSNEEVSARFKAVQLALKKKLLVQLRKQRSTYGSEGGDVEGLVFRDLDSGALTKLVDRDYFSALNKFMWFYRELLGRGVKVGEKWVPGIGAQLKSYLSTEVLGSAALKSPAFVSNLKKRYGRPKTEKETDVVLARYVKDTDLMKGDFVSRFRSVVEKTRREFEAVRGDWERKRKGDVVFTSADGRQKKMDDLIKQRTDAAYAEMEETLSGLARAADTVKSIADEDTRKVAMMKVVLGHRGVEKLREGRSIVEAPPPVPADVRKVPMSVGGKHALGLDTPAALDVLKKNSDKLFSKKGIDVKQLRALGQGTRGSAFDVGDNRVLKVTNDGLEAVAANKLKEFSLKHVARFYDVFRFPTEDSRLGYIYGIVQEKLTPLEKNEANCLNFDLWDPDIWGEKTEIPQTIVKAGYDWDVVRTLVIQNTQVLAQKETDPEKQKEILVGANEAWKRLNDRFHIGDMVRELSAKGIKFHDYHAGNVMKRANGDYVIIDIGYSRVTGGKEPPVLERLVKEIACLVEAHLARRDAIAAAAQKKFHPTIYSAIEASKPLLTRHGMKLGNKLGEGSYGLAFDVGGNKVLKITTDDLEARASNHVKGKRLRHVVRIEQVFQIPGAEMGGGPLDKKSYPVYGILEEKLSPISVYEEEEFELVTDLLQASGAGNAILSGDYDKVLGAVQTKISEPDVRRYMDSVMRKFQLPEIFKELHDSKVEFLDYHKGNIMKRGEDFVVIDLGLSHSPGKEPPVLENIIRKVLAEFKPRFNKDSQVYVGVTPTGWEVEAESTSLSEVAADTVGVTIGRYQPFHRGHAEVIRELARTHTKVIVLVAGNTTDRKNPFSYETRLFTMKNSLPDVWSKIDVYKATSGVKNSGFVPFVLADIIRKGNRSLKGDTAVEILVGPDRFDQMEQQLERARQYRNAGRDIGFDPDLAIVRKVDAIRNDDDTERVSGTRVRNAVLSGDKETVKSFMDPHLTSNPALFEEVYVKMREELVRPGQVKEALSDIGEDGIVSVINSHKDSLKKNKHVDVGSLKKLGSGQMGIAYDMGGGKVFKVTTSVSEARSNMVLKGKNLPHIVRIYDVFRMDDPSQKKVPVYGIIRENLQSLAGSEKSELDDLVDLLRDGKVFDTTVKGDFDKTMDAVRRLMIQEIRRELSLPQEPPPDPEAVQGNKRELRAAGLIDQKMMELEGRLRHYQVDKMMEELNGLSIQFGDYKGDNIMKRGSDYVVSDVGGGSTGGEPPLLERIVEAIVNEIGVTFNTNAPGGTQAGVRAGSSGWSSPHTMYGQEDIEAARSGTFNDVWSDSLAGVGVRMGK